MYIFFAINEVKNYITSFVNTQKTTGLMQPHT